MPDHKFSGVLRGAAVGLTGVFMLSAQAQGLSDQDKMVVREMVRQEMALERARRDHAALSKDASPPRKETRSCRRHDYRSVISYTSDDGALRTGIRLKRDSVSIELRYMFDAGLTRSAGGQKECREVSNWQGWAPIIYREVAVDKGNFTRDEIIRQTNEEFYQRQQLQGPVSSDPGPSPRVLPVHTGGDKNLP